jgi:hypothetical protein
MTYTTYKDDDGVHYSENELQEQYDDMIRECYDTTTIAGLEYDTARALREVDPIAYRCGLADYIDSLDLEEVSNETVAEFLAALNQ